MKGTGSLAFDGGNILSKSRCSFLFNCMQRGVEEFEDPANYESYISTLDSLLVQTLEFGAEVALTLGKRCA